MTVGAMHGGYLFAQQFSQVPGQAQDVSRQEFEDVKRVQAEQADRLAKVRLQLEALTVRLGIDLGSEE